MLAAVYRARRGSHKQRQKLVVPSAQAAEEPGEKRRRGSDLPSTANDAVHPKKRKIKGTARQRAAPETETAAGTEPVDPASEATEIQKPCQNLKSKAAEEHSQEQVLAAHVPVGVSPPKKSKTSGAARRRAAAEARSRAERGPAESLATQVPPDSAQAPEISAVQVPELEPPPMTQAELQEVQVSGSGAESPDLKPWLSFEDVRKGGPKGKLPSAVVSYMGKFKNFKDPTPIQAYCWPAACAGRNVVGISKTGSGKTLAYVCPGLSRILSYKRAAVPTFGPYAVVLAPTRELTIQIAKEAKGLCKALNIQLACLYGGASKAEQIKSLDKGVDFIVAAPGRLDDLASKPDKFTGATLISLSMVSYLVLDEADCMLDLGFEPQVRRLLIKVAENRQLLCFSATWPKKVESLVQEFSKDVLSIRIGSSALAGVAGNQNVEQKVVIIRAGHQGDADREAKKQALWNILWERHEETCLVFCAMKKTAAVLAHQLKEDGFSARGLHGDMLQQDREVAMRAFKTGEVKILVATDVAARGLDVKGIALVVSYDPPSQLEEHVHRIGRTARGKAMHGVAYTLLGSDDVRQAKLVAESMRSAGQAVPPELLELSLRRVENSQTRKLAKQRAKKKQKLKGAVSVC
eukprot:TRINITY_DN30301_c0_g1_i1.p1 TRINITY_DN30301_c0_g1~~TRINITY_DN30301_c0_g1_i1.p1  ORF type:complete len:653 (-),score=149.36 TRINITY_DN30301_c0_g1_i1:262-2163(-)